MELRYQRSGDGTLLIRPGGYREQWPLNLAADPRCEFLIDGAAVECWAFRTEDGGFRLVPVSTQGRDSS